MSIVIKIRKVEKNIVKFGAQCALCKKWRSAHIQVQGALAAPVYLLPKGKEEEFSIFGNFIGCENPNECENYEPGKQRIGDGNGDDNGFVPDGDNSG